MMEDWDDYDEFYFSCLNCEKQIDEPNFCSKECEGEYEKCQKKK